MLKDSLPTSHPISLPVNDAANIVFDDIAYLKGRAMLSMLEAFVGADAFQSGVQEYIHRYMFSNGAMNDLWNTLTEVTGFPVAQVMNTWTLQMGYPVITVTYQGGEVTFNQSRFLLNPNTNASQITDSPYSYEWYVKLPYSLGTQSGLDRSVSEVWMNRSHTTVTVPRHSSTNGNYVVANLEFAAFVLVNYDESNWRSLGRALSGNPQVLSETTRLAAVHDAFLLARAGHLNYHVTFSFLRFLGQDATVTSWGAFGLGMDYIQAMMSNSVAYTNIRSYVREHVSPVVSKLGYTPLGGVDVNQARAQILHLAVMHGDEGVYQHARNFFTSWRINPNNEIPGDQKLLIMSAAIRGGSPQDWLYLYRTMNSTTDPGTKAAMRAALCYSKEMWLLWRYLYEMFDSPTEHHLFPKVLSHYSVTEQSRIVAYHFLKENWARLFSADKFGDDQFAAPDILRPLRYLNTRQEKEEIQDLYDRHGPTIARLAINELYAYIDANIYWKQNRQQEIEEIFASEESYKRYLSTYRTV